MLKANIDAQIQQLNIELDTKHKDLRRLFNIQYGINVQIKDLKEDIDKLEYKIMQLEEELVDNE